MTAKTKTPARALPPDAPAWMNDALRQGFQYLNAGNTDAASECCRRILQTRTDVPQAHFLVGLIALELDQRWTAVQAFGSVTKLDPKNGPAWAHIAKLFMAAGQPARADKALENACRFEDGNPVVQDLIGSVYSLLGDQQEALGWYGKAALQQPRNPAFRVNHANTLMYLGQLDEAEAELREVLEFSPGNPNAHWVLSGLRKATDRAHVDEIDGLLAKGVQSPQAQAFLYYGKGKELEDLEQWDEAFEAFAAGAAARRQTLEYDEASEVAMYDALERLFDEDWLAAGPPGDDDPSPIFVVGQPRTGTTLVERIITAHPDVHSAGELKQFGNALRRLTKYREPQRFSAKLIELAADVDPVELGRSYLRTSQKMRGNAPRFVDKLPSNFLYLPLILKALPNAKIVHLRRHPMDACFSSFKQLFADAYPHSYDLEEMGRHHARYFRLMQVWRDRFGERFFEIDYEKVAADVEPHARALIDFLGIGWDDACLEFHRQKTAVTTASAVQVRKPAHTKSVGRWRRYERQLEPLQGTLAELGVPLELD